MSNYMYQRVSTQQLNMVDNNVLSSGIKQYMEDGYDYNQAVMEILKREGWELQGTEGNGDLRFYNVVSDKFANATRHNDMYVPTTTDNLCINAFRVVNNGIHSTVEPNEWTSTYDSRRGKRAMKKQLWRDKMDRKRQKGSLNVSRTS